MITAIRADEGSNLQNNTGTNDCEPPAFVICYESQVLFFLLHPHGSQSPAEEGTLHHELVQPVYRNTILQYIIVILRDD